MRKLLCVLCLMLGGCAMFQSEGPTVEALQTKIRQKANCDAVCSPFQAFVCWPNQAICLTATRDAMKRVDLN